MSTPNHVRSNLVDCLRDPAGSLATGIFTAPNEQTDGSYTVDAEDIMHGVRGFMVNTAGWVAVVAVNDVDSNGNFTVDDIHYFNAVLGATYSVRSYAFLAVTATPPGQASPISTADVGIVCLK